MKFFGINASPRKNGNCAELLKHALEGITKADSSAQTELHHLYSYTYTGCKSCYACKLRDGKFYGVCALRDDISPLLQELNQADGILLASPIFFGDISGAMHCFLERLLFPNLTYTEGHASIAPKKIPVAMFYAMNVTREIMEEWHYPERLSVMEGYVGHIFGEQPLHLYANNTVQFNDYSRYVCTMFSGEEKKKYREEQFSLDCQKAEEIGVQILGRSREYAG